MQDRAEIIADLTFDHRSSIITYMETQADKMTAVGRKAEASALLATASSIKARLDISQGKGGIASPIDIIGLEICSALSGAVLRDILQKDRGDGAMRAYFGTVYVAKKRLGWSNECIGEHLGRDASTISHALKRAEEIRSQDSEFRRVTDEMTLREIRCEHCTMPLIHQTN